MVGCNYGLKLTARLFLAERPQLSLRISLTYDSPTGTGKTTAHTDTYHGHFVKLVPSKQVVEVMEFETADAAKRDEMLVTGAGLMVGCTTVGWKKDG